MLFAVLFLNSNVKTQDLTLKLDFGDGTYLAGGPSSDNVYSHTFTVAGSYTITLYVIDNDGSMARAQSTVVVL